MAKRRLIGGRSSAAYVARPVLDRLTDSERTRTLLYRLGRYIYSQARLENVDWRVMASELALQEALLADCSEGDTLIDIGANVGLWTRNALIVNPGVVVHAYEPVPATFAELSSRLAREVAKGSVVPVQAGVSSTSGSTTMQVFDPGLGRSGINSLYLGSSVDTTEVSVDLITLADAVKRCQPARIRMIKIDTEGHDFSVLAGGEEVLNAGQVDLIQFEYNVRWVNARAFLRDVFDLIEPTDYSLGKITPAGIELYERWHPELERFFEANYVLLHPRARGLFPTIRTTFGSRNTPIAVAATARGQA